MASMTGKVYAITGGASGMGLAAAKLLYMRGASISIGDVDETALAATTTFFKDTTRILLSKVDVSENESVQEWMKRTITKFGKLDGACNSAGVIGKHHGIKAVEELEDDQWDLIIKVNLTGMMYSMRAELQNMKTGPGSIVCISSVQGSMGFAKHAAYAASKHGVLGLVRSAAKEVGNRNIRVNAITPGAIDTPLMDKRNALFGGKSEQPDTPIYRLGTAEEVGNLIVFLLSDEASFISGATYAIDGGWVC